MIDEKITVRSYSGHRADEAPRSFVLRDEEIDIIEITDMWIEEGFADRTRRRFFTVMDGKGFTYKIYRDDKTEQWFLSITGPPGTSTMP